MVDVFLGTGLGARSYAVIEQGMIGRIVDSSPMQLREFIEEAVKRTFIGLTKANKLEDRGPGGFGGRGKGPGKPRD